MDRRAPMGYTLVMVSALASTLFAQDNTGETGTPMGSKGFEWQAEQQLAKEELLRFRADTARLPLEEWKEKALAWARFQAGETEVRVDQLFRVSQVLADRNAATEIAPGATEENPAWVILFAKKKPQGLNLVLSDEDATEVRCSMKEVTAEGSGYVGVFQQDSALLCLARKPG